MTDEKRLWPRFSPEINLGHLLQAVVIMITIGGGAITSYLSLRSDIQQVRADLTVRVSERPETPFPSRSRLLTKYPGLP